MLISSPLKCGFIRGEKRNQLLLLKTISSLETETLKSGGEGKHIVSDYNSDQLMLHAVFRKGYQQLVSWKNEFVHLDPDCPSLYPRSHISGWKA